MKKIIALIIIAIIMGILVKKAWPQDNTKGSQFSLEKSATLAENENMKTSAKNAPALTMPVSRDSAKDILKRLDEVYFLFQKKNETDPHLVVQKGEGYVITLPCSGIPPDTIERNYGLSLTEEDGLTTFYFTEAGNGNRYPHIVTSIEYDRHSQKAILKQKVELSADSVSDMPVGRAAFEKFKDQIRLLECLLHF